MSRRTAVAIVAWLGLAAAGCAVRPFEPVDLSGPGWTVRRGQAVWKAGADRPPIAGDVMLARHADGDVLIEFAKPPFPVFTARTADGAWRIELIEGGREHAGHGAPPARFVWFWMPGIVLDNSPPPGDWRLERGEGVLRLTHPRRDQSIRLVLDP